MNLIIHDLNDEQWQKIAGQYEGWQIVRGDETTRPCTGCFNCWNRTPGQCVMKDGFDNMGYLIHHAEQIVIMSRYTYGGFSSSVKSVIDRCLGYVLPHFELVNGETHHQKRYDEDKAITYVFYGHDLTDEQKKCAERYVTAVCTNMRTHVKEVIFQESGAEPERKPRAGGYESEKTVLLNGSLRHKSGNTDKLARELAGRLNGEAEIVNLALYRDKPEELMNILTGASTLVMCQPLYVDGLPASMIRLMERMQREYDGPAKRIYTLANMGLYESRQLINLMTAIRQWSDEMGFTYGGGLAVGAGELVGGLMEMEKITSWPLTKIGRGMNRLAEAINNGNAIEDIYAQTDGFPKWLYMAIANSGWKGMAKKNGISPDELFRRL